MPYDPKKDGERRKKENETLREKFGFGVAVTRQAIRLERKAEIEELERQEEENKKKAPASIWD